MIQLKNITKIYLRGQTEVHALRGISCEIPSNSFSFIVGPSGSGKSTLLYLLGALDEPTEGEILVDGRSLTGMNSAELNSFRREDVGFVFQSFNLLKNLDAVDNVLVPFFPQGIPPAMRRQAIELLTTVGLQDRLDHRPSHLSGGEQQRVAIARALLKEPKMILADEPTGELDSKTGAEIFDYLRKLQKEQQTTIVVVTHDESLIREGDFVLRLKDGQIE